ncbi:MAG: hypothetical protein IJX46_00605 [Clostridia bacterium]|nr:hypothetical protein [Clostridia bacterium]
MPKQNNTSYNACMSELHARYSDRGVKASAGREAAGQMKREASGPNAYLISRVSRNADSAAYRNGEFNGQKYMTSGDFLKYYNNRKTVGGYARPVVQSGDKAQTKEFRRAPQVNDLSRQPARNPADTGRMSAVKQSGTVTMPASKASRFDPNAETIVLPSVKEQKSLRSRINRLVRKWFPKEDKKEETTTFKRNVPVAAIGLIVSASLAMTMIIGSSVMASEANVEVSDLKYDISVLKEEGETLEERLSRKENLAEIKDYATNQLGMISKDYVASEYLALSGDDSVESYEEDEGVNVDLSTLLSGIFGN